MPDSNLLLDELILNNDYTLLLLEKIDRLIEVQFNLLVIIIFLVILGVIYSVVQKFIR